jgi:hypothetical protein
MLTCTEGEVEMGTNKEAERGQMKKIKEKQEEM